MSEKVIFNPLSEDFSYEWLDDTNTPQKLTVRSMDVGEFTKSQGEFMAKHLVDRILDVRGIKTNHKDEFQATLKEITIK